MISGESLSMTKERREIECVGLEHTYNGRLSTAAGHLLQQ